GRIHKSKDIVLPNQLNKINHIAVDIGGSLAKIVYYNHKKKTIKFYKIESSLIPSFFFFLKKLISSLENDVSFESNYNINNSQNISNPNQQFKNNSINIAATGGGAVKFEKLISHNKSHNKSPYLRAFDEMECLIVGLNFLINNIPDEIFIYDESLKDISDYDLKRIRFIKFHELLSSKSSLSLNSPLDSSIDSSSSLHSIYPYLLVNIGSGVSMIKVTGPKSFERIGGSSIGGGTLWGLLSLLTNAKSYDDMLHMALNGDNAGVDMLVGDIYGTDYNKIGLKSTTIASTFGKVFKKITGQVNGGYDNNDESVFDSEFDSKESLSFNRLSQFKQEDISRSLLYAISNNIGQISYLHAEKHNLKKIFFAGSFIRNHIITIRTLSYAINFWSNGNKRAYFLRHESYLGSLGAFL
ncbi:pantothenate kinase, partial [Ascoidea rubescens DSM 1968]